jgi:hypothetical protein
MRPMIDTCAATCPEPMFGWWQKLDWCNPNTFIKTKLIPYEENVQTCPSFVCEGTKCSKCTRPN